MYERLLMLHKGQDGLSLVSVVVAFTILVAVVGPATYLIERSTQLSVASRQQITASNLAQSEIQIFNAEAAQSFDNLTNMLGTSNHTTIVGPITYTLSDNLYWTEGTSNPSGCSANASGSQSLEPILAATVTVTWSNMGAQPPVRATTGYHVPAGYSSPSTGSVLVIAQNQATSPDNAVTVSLLRQGAAADTAQTVQTDAQGCAFFPFLNPGTYVVSLSAPSGETWLDPSGNQNPTQTVSVTASADVSADFTYAQASTIDIVAPQISVPWQFGISLGSTSLPGGETIFAPSGSPPQVTAFPAITGYQVWLGQCVLYPSFGGTSLGEATMPLPGATTSANLLGQPVTVTVTQNGAPTAGAPVSIVQTNAAGEALTGCTNPLTQVGITNSSGQVTFLAPIGDITFDVTNGSTSTIYPQSGAVATPGGGSLDVAITLS